jgi:predicted nucleic acid-binding protein
VRIALDTSVLIPLVQPGDLNEHDRMIKERMIGAISGTKVQVVIPAPAVAELAANPRLSAEQREILVKKIVTQFEVAALDATAVVRAGALMALPASSKGENKQCLKVDALILACAVAAGCDVLYAADPHLALIGDGEITVLEPPAVVREQEFEFAPDLPGTRESNGVIR